MANVSLQGHNHPRARSPKVSLPHTSTAHPPCDPRRAFFLRESRCPLQPVRQSRDSAASGHLLCAPHSPSARLPPVLAYGALSRVLSDGTAPYGSDFG